MNSGLVDSISEIIEESGVAAENIELELTETFLMENLAENDNHPARAEVARIQYLDR